MRIPLLVLTLVVALNLFVDWYIFRYLRAEFRNRIWCKIQFWSAVVLELGLVSLYVLPVNSASDTGLVTLMWVIFGYISIYLPKYIFVVFDCIGRLPVLWHRRPIKGVGLAGAIIGLILFLALWWGALFNRFNIDVKEVSVPITGLPTAFEDFRIVQLSDLHVGTYGNDTTFISRIVDRVNSLHPDMVCFTGDIVNRHTSELEPFVSVLSRLKAPYGVYSILGNHDYGDYYRWNNDSERQRNNDQLAMFQKQMGWTLLKNDYRLIAKDNDTIAVIGVENIGDPPFHVYGNFASSYPTPVDSRTKILLSHNPAHWEKDIANSDKNVALTLSGHTHAMQMSAFGWSPAAGRYREWGGLYADANGKHWLYVNIGTGTVGFPARIGATPEITVLTLKRKN